MTRRLIILAALACLSFGQQTRGPFIAEHTYTLSSSAAVHTVHLPATARSARAQIIGIWVYSTAAIQFAVERDGTAPTATAISIRRVNRTGGAQTDASATAFRDSNVGSAQQFWEYNLTAAGTYPIDMAGKELRRGDNITVRTASGTATVRISIMWSEF